MKIMMTKKKVMVARALSFIFILCLLGASMGNVHAQTPENKYFSETGHNVSGEFLKFYSNDPNATFLFGYPITEEFTSKDGETVQYFQRARFEFHADQPEGQRVQVTPLGSLTYVSAGPLNLATNTFACRTYKETGYAVCLAFLEFFDQYGGVARFGYPISPFEYHENKIVQYFENARLEWQPRKPEGQRVVVSDLGRVYFDMLGEDLGLLPPVKALDNSPQVINKLLVRAFAWKAVTLASDSQTIFVIAQDQNQQPVANASCAAVVHWSNTREETFTLATNKNGIAVIPLNFVNQPYGKLIHADVTCSYKGLNNRSSTSFRIWY